MEAFDKIILETTSTILLQKITTKINFGVWNVHAKVKTVDYKGMHMSKLVATILFILWKFAVIFPGPVKYSFLDRRLNNYIGRTYCRKWMFCTGRLQLGFVFYFILFCHQESSAFWPLQIGHLFCDLAVNICRSMESETFPRCFFPPQSLMFIFICLFARTQNTGDFSKLIGEVDNSDVIHMALRAWLNHNLLTWHLKILLPKAALGNSWLQQPHHNL